MAITKAGLTDRTHADPIHVVHAYEHAIGSLRPKIRYYVGAMTLPLRLVAVLPSGISDWLVRSFIGLLGLGLPAPDAAVSLAEERAADARKAR